MKSGGGWAVRGGLTTVMLIPQVLWTQLPCGHCDVPASLLLPIPPAPAAERSPTQQPAVPGPLKAAAGWPREQARGGPPGGAASGPVGHRV